MLPVRSDLSKRAASVRFVCTAEASRAGPPGAADEQKERGVQGNVMKQGVTE